MSEPWYQTFFAGVVVEMWRSAVPDEATRAEAEFLIRHLGVAPGARLLDVPCGHGRHAIELALRGFRLTAVDLSPEMVEAARGSAASRGVEVDWQLADMRRLPSDGSFDGAYCFGNSFGYLGPEGDREFLSAVAGALSPGGRFAMHTGMVAETVLPRLEERGWSPIGDLLFLEENRYDATESCLETEYTFVQSDGVRRRTARHWVYTVRELRAMLDDADFTTCGLYASTDDEPFELDAPQLLLVAEKR